MGIELPPELAAVATAAGVTWPQADEDAMREAAQAWRDAGTQMSTLTGDADTVARTTLATVEGETGTAAANHWTKFVAPDTGYLTSTARACAGAADRLDHAAEQVGAAKVEIVRNLVALAKNSDAANQAAAAGNPSALLGLDTAVRGTAVNVAAIKDTLISAVQPASGQDVSAVRDVVNANPGVHGSPLLGGLLETATGTAAGLTQTVGDVAQTATGGLADGAVAGLSQTVGGVTETVGGVTRGVTETVGGVSEAVTGTVGGVTDTVGGVTRGVTGTVGGVSETVTGTVSGVTHGVAETATGATHGLMQTADGTTRDVVGAAGEVAQVDFYGGDANAGTGPIRLPMDAIADAPTPPTGFPAIANDAIQASAAPTPSTGFPAVANETVQAASAAVLDAPAQAPAAQAQPGAPTGNAPGMGGQPGGVPATGAPLTGGPAGAALGGGPVGGGAVAGGGPAQGGGRQQQPAPGRESTAVPVTDQRGRQGGGLGTPARQEGSARAGEESSGFGAAFGYLPGGGQYGSGQSAGGQFGRPSPDASPGAQPAHRGQSGGQATAQPHGGVPGGQGQSGGQATAQPHGGIPSQPGAQPPGQTAQPPGGAPATSTQSPTGPGATPNHQQAGARPAGYVAAALDQPAPDHADHREPPPQDGSLALFLVHMFPIGHLPKATGHPARQLPAPPAELDYAAGLRFEADDHPESGLIDLTTRGPAAEPSEGAEAPAELTVDYDPLAGQHERDWDRRFLVRDTHPVEYAWPPGELYPEGGSAEGEPEVLAPDTEIDRFGTPEGRVFSRAATRFGARSLPPAHLEAGYRRYRVLRPIPVWRSISAPWFGQPGGGERYRATQSAADLLALGYLAETTHGDEQ